MSALPSFQESALMHSLRAIFAAQATPTAAQLQAWKTFNQLGLPGFRDEHWKYTQLHRLYSQSFSTQQTVPSVSIQPGAILIINGKLQSIPAASSGLTIKQVVSSSTKATQPFVALNYALNPDEIAIDIADNAVIEQPLVIECISVGEHSVTAPRIRLTLGQHSKLSVIERHRNDDDIPHFNSVAMNIELGENSRLEHCRLQDENRHGFHIASIAATVNKQAQYINHQFNLGGSLGRLNINVQLQGAEAYAELNGLQFAAGNQVHDTHSRIEHCVPRARSSETYHGIADERGQVVFNGKVMVHKHAIGTDAQQSSRNLLLSPKAEIDTKPELEIYADDVKCAHGATVGQLDNNALFYLRSRGISEQQARALLTLAFADAVINKVPVIALREELTRQVHARFGTAVEVAS